MVQLVLVIIINFLRNRTERKKLRNSPGFPAQWSLWNHHNLVPKKRDGIGRKASLNGSSTSWRRNPVDRYIYASKTQKRFLGWREGCWTHLCQWTQFGWRNECIWSLLKKQERMRGKSLNSKRLPQTANLAKNNVL